MDDHNARLCVLESTAVRHEEDIKKLWEKLTDLEICAASLPTINASIERIGIKMEKIESDISGMKVVSKEQATRLAIIAGAAMLIASAVFTALINLAFRVI